MHANGGATDARGTAIRPIYGPSLDGTLPGNEVIVQSSGSGRITYARAMGPMQFLPGTWARYASDGDGDGVADPQNLYDATLAAARYLCTGGLNLRDQSQVMAAILRYNNSMPYAQNVLGWAAAYATGVIPVDLPPHYRTPTAARRCASGEPRGHRAEPAAQHPRPITLGPACADAADRPERDPEQQPAIPVAADRVRAPPVVHGDLHRPRHRWPTAPALNTPPPGVPAFAAPARCACHTAWRLHGSCRLRRLHSPRRCQPRRPQHRPRLPPGCRAAHRPVRRRRPLPRGRLRPRRRSSSQRLPRRRRLLRCRPAGQPTGPPPGPAPGQLTGSSPNYTRR